MRRLAVFAAALIASAVPVFAQQYSYSIEGTNLDGSPYGGTAVIQWISDSTCVIEWTTGPSVSTGICMRNGPAFAAAYVLGGGTGLVVYQIMDNGRLEGLWTIAGQNGAGTEVLTPQ